MWQTVQLKTLKLFGSWWHSEHARPACFPDVIGNHVWLKRPWLNDESAYLWHVSQAVGKPAARWFGLVVRSYCAW